MSGHSKWAQIKRQKGLTDIKRGQTFTKIANAITIAVREGGGASPQQNVRLRLAIDKARSVNMPKENIERAIARGKGVQGKGADLSELVYEGFGPGGVAVVVEAASDNKQRTAAAIKNVFAKCGGTLAAPGAVAYQFQTVGLVSVGRKEKSLDEVFLLAADAGAMDVEDAGEEVLVYTRPEELSRIRDILAKSLSVTTAELIRKPTASVPIQSREEAKKVFSFIEQLEGLDDVQKVYASFDIPDELLGATAP